MREHRSYEALFAAAKRLGYGSESVKNFGADKLTVLAEAERRETTVDFLENMRQTLYQELFEREVSAALGEAVAGLRQKFPNADGFVSGEGVLTIFLNGRGGQESD
jgi:hypothetical protein